MTTLRDYQYALQMKMDECKKREDIIEALSEELIYREHKIRCMDREITVLKESLDTSFREGSELRRSIHDLEEKLLEAQCAPRTSGSGSFYATAYVSPSRSRLNRERAILLRESLPSKRRESPLSKSEEHKSKPGATEVADLMTEKRQKSDSGMVLQVATVSTPDVVLVKPDSLSVTMEPMFEG